MSGREDEIKTGPPNPERITHLIEGYIEAIAKHQMPGQDSPAAQRACSYEEGDPDPSRSRHYWIDYEFMSVDGEQLFLRFQHAGHIPATNISWNNRLGGHVRYFESPSGLLLLYVNGGDAWFDPRPMQHVAYVSAADPSRPNVSVSASTMRASQDWLSSFLDGGEEDFRCMVEDKVAGALEMYETGQVVNIAQCADWLDAEGQTNRLYAQHLPEQLMHCFTALHQATGIMSFNDWAKLRDNLDDDDN